MWIDYFRNSDVSYINYSKWIFFSFENKINRKFKLFLYKFLFLYKLNRYFNNKQNTIIYKIITNVKSFLNNNRNIIIIQESTIMQTRHKEFYLDLIISLFS